MASTPISIRSVETRSPLEVLVSPHSLPQRKVPKHLSTSLSSLQQSPNLPEVTENDFKSARRRHSRNFSTILPLSKTPSSSYVDDLGTRPSSRWSKDQLLQHYSQCMKLSQENKINHKNAFDLQLIEHMGEMIRQDGALNFRMAGGTIFAGAKIYASRVDAIHSEIYRVLSSLGSGDKDDIQVEEDQDNFDFGRKLKKRKKNSKILETNEASLRVPFINSCGSIHFNEKAHGSAIDAACCESIMANQLQLCDTESILHHDASIQTIKPLEFEACTETTTACFHVLLNSNFMDNLSSSSKFTCDAFKGLCFDPKDMNLDFGESSSVLCDQTEASQSDFDDRGLEEALDFSSTDHVVADDEDDNVFPDPVSTAPDHQEKSYNATHAVDIAHFVATAPSAEYSYFKPNVLSVGDGPSHWLRHKNARSALIAPLSQGDNQFSEGAQVKKRKIIQKDKKFQRQRVIKDKKTQPQKMSKAKIESLRVNVQDQLLLESADLNPEQILRAMEVKVVLRQLNSAALKQDQITIINEADVINFNYNDLDYCPADVDNDYVDEVTNDNSCDIFQHSSGFFPDFTQNATSVSPENEYNELLEGNHLISQPKKTERIQVHFSKHAKRIDVRKLKGAMWSLIQGEKDTGDGRKSGNLETDADTCKEDEKSTASEQETPSSSHPLMFSKMYDQLPNNVSKNMWESMSVPLAFTCLLHLANEKQLKVEGMSTLSDLKISQTF